MNCLTARRILLLGDTHIGDAGSLRARQHVAECQECRLFFKQESQLRELFRAKLPKRTVSPGFRERVLSAVAKERQQKTGSRTMIIFRQMRWGRIALSTAAVVTLVLFYVFSPPWGQHDVEWADSVVNTLIQDHLAIKLKEHPLDLETSEKTHLERWLAARVDFNVAVPQFVGAKLEGGHLCLIGGKRSVSLSFDNNNVPVTLYMIDRSILDLTRLRTISSINGKSVFLYDAKGCNMLLWEQRGLVYAIVSDSSEKELIKLITQMS